MEFKATHPSLCDNPTASPNSGTSSSTSAPHGGVNVSAPLTCMSQPCMPVSNIGPTKVMPHLYLGSQHDALSQEIMQASTMGSGHQLNLFDSEVGELADLRCYTFVRFFIGDV